MGRTKTLIRNLDLDLKKLTVPGVVMLAFWTLATVLWQTSGEIMALFFFGYIGTSVGIGLGLYAALPKKKKPLGRRLSLLLVGTFLVGRFIGMFLPSTLGLDAYRAYDIARRAKDSVGSLTVIVVEKITGFFRRFSVTIE